MSSGDRKRVVVLGGGYSGGAAAKKLDQTKGIEVIWVSPREDGFILHKIGALRAAVAGGNW